MMIDKSGISKVEDKKAVPTLEPTMESLSEEVLKNDWSKPEEDEAW